jgi:hypothetical protein
MRERHSICLMLFFVKYFNFSEGIEVTLSIEAFKSSVAEQLESRKKCSSKGVSNSEKKGDFVATKNFNQKVTVHGLWTVDRGLLISQRAEKKECSATTGDG